MIYERLSDPDQKNHRHQRRRDAEHRLKIIDRHVRGPPGTPETKEEDAAVGEYPCGHEEEKHIHRHQSEHHKDDARDDDPHSGVHRLPNR